MKKVLRILLGIAFSVCIVIGGYVLMKQIEYNQMVEIVKSNEARVVFERTLKNIEQSAFEEQGFIQDYRIDTSSVRKNPMGGISVRIIINGDEDLFVQNILEKDLNGELYNSSGSSSIDLSIRLESKYD